MSWLIAALGVMAALFLLTVAVGAPFVPSRRRDVTELFDALRIGPEDTVLDIGAGDGVVMGQAAARGARAIGIEINPLLVLWARWRLCRYGNQVQVMWGDMRRRRLDTSVTLIYCFGAGLFVTDIARIARQQAARQGAPLRLASYGFSVPGLGQEQRIGPYKLYTVKPDFTDSQA